MTDSGVRVAIDPIINELAARQHGVVARRQLVAAGVTPHAVRHSIRKGRLVLVHRGVYRVGPLRAPLERYAAALLAFGPEVVLGFTTAGALWGLIDDPPGESPVDVIVPRQARSMRKGIRIHRLGAVREGERTVRNGLAITKPARSLIDLANVLPSRALENALARGLRDGIVQHSRLERLVDRHSTRRGVRRLRELLREDEPAMTRSHAEEMFLELMRDADLKGFRTNARVKRYEVDVLWEHERVIAEIDGREFHKSSDMFESDRKRDSVLVGAGYTVLRVTYKQLNHEPRSVIGRVARALGIGGERRR